MVSYERLTLIGESFSPWTKKARWALEHCGLSFGYEEYTPTLSEPWLRWRLRQWRGRVSVPVLLTDNGVCRGSWAIASYANAAAGDQRLGDLAKVEPWDALSEAALAEGRTAVVRRILANDDALAEGLPDVIPAVLRRPLRFLSADALRRLDKKYAPLAEPGALRRGLTALRDGLATAGGDYLLGAFSYADMTMAAVLEVIAPLAEAEPPLGPAMAQCWRDDALADEYRDLLDWYRRLAESPLTSYSQFHAVQSPGAERPA